MAKKPHGASQQSAAAIDAMLALAAERGWYAVSLADIAQRAKIGLAELHEQFEGKDALLREFVESVDLAVLKGELPEAEASVRDRLFDVIMRRFDAMKPHREGIRAILRDLRGDPCALLFGVPRLLATASLMLEAAGVSASGPGGRLKAKAVAAIYLSTMRTWLADDSADMARTMSALDRALRRVEGVAMLFCRGRRGSADPAEGSEPAKV